MTPGLPLPGEPTVTASESLSHRGRAVTEKEWSVVRELKERSVSDRLKFRNKL